jgi:hypothetical protein
LTTTLIGMFNKCAPALNNLKKHLKPPPNSLLVLTLTRTILHIVLL